MRITASGFLTEPLEDAGEEENTVWVVQEVCVRPHAHGRQACRGVQRGCFAQSEMTGRLH